MNLQARGFSLAWNSLEIANSFGVDSKQLHTILAWHSDRPRETLLHAVPLGSDFSRASRSFALKLCRVPNGLASLRCTFWDASMGTHPRHYSSCLILQWYERVWRR